MSSFGGKRKARVIKVSDEDERAESAPSSGEGDTPKDLPKPAFGLKSGRKPLRQSGLKKIFTPGDEDDGGGPQGSDEDDGPRVVRPNVGRNKSSGMKKRPVKAPQLSLSADSTDGADEDTSDAKPLRRAPFGQRVLEQNAAKRGLGNRGLPLRSMGDDDDRPRYSKEYLSELQSSTPNTPQPLASDVEADTMDLDSSELEGAIIVESSDAAISQPKTAILTDAEVQERKERRTRLAKENEFLSVENDDDDDLDQFDRKKKEEKRLTAEDEELGEGFENYVEDGGLALGRRAERERRRKDRKQMAEMISAAEGHSSESSEESDAERRIAYEAAQTRAGMDGLKKPRKKPAEEMLQVPPKITPLPSLTECLGRLQLSLRSMEGEIKTRSARVQQLRSEKEEIAKREAEVQALLDETGRKYQEVMGKGTVDNGTMRVNGPAVELVRERGLESLGTTPSRRDEDDVMEL